MPHLNIEIKARCRNPDQVREILRKQHAEFRGVDHQVDTYFRTKRGRLKLREGNIENSLIYYDRPDQAAPKPSTVTLYHPTPGSTLKELLVNALGIVATVCKDREIYFIDNVKFHIDTVQQLGSFVEIEAIDTTSRIEQEALLSQCKSYMTLLGIQDHDLLDRSYSDMIAQKASS